MMASLGQDDVDIVISDPPYPKGVQENLCSGSLVGTKSVPKYELPFEPLSRSQHAWLGHACRAARRWVLSFCAVEDFGRFQDLLPEEYVRGGVWYKKNAMGQLTADRPATAYEGVAILHNTRTKLVWNGRGSYGIWACNGTRGKPDRHPNEKPVDLLLKLVALFTNRGEVVLDPFCGSGAVGEACLRLGRSYIGFDSDKYWVNRTWARLKNLPANSDVTDEQALALCRMKEAA